MTPRPTTHRIHLTGRNHTWTAPMSDMQRERAEPPLQPVEHPTLFGCDFPPIAWGGVATVICAPILYFLGAFG